MFALIEQYYEQFGREVIDIIMVEFSTCGTLAALLKDLGIPSPATIEAQHTTLSLFLEMYGATHFVKCLSTEERREKRAAQKRELIEKAILNRINNDTPAVQVVAPPCDTPGPNMVSINDTWIRDRRSSPDRRKGVGRRQRITLDTENRRRGDRRFGPRRAKDGQDTKF